VKNTILVHQRAMLLSENLYKCTKNFLLLSKLVSQDDEKIVFGWLGHLVPQILGQNQFHGAHIKQDIK